MSDEKKWLKEYKLFLEAGDTSDAAIPKALAYQLLSKMEKLINPSAWIVFAKILGIQFVVGLFSLSVCHQFGMNPFGTERSMDAWFMDMWGHHICMVICGVLFVGLGVLIASLILSIEELRVLRKTKFQQTLALGVVSLLIFVGFGAELAISIAGLWLLGGLAGGVIVTEATWRVKQANL